MPQPPLNVASSTTSATPRGQRERRLHREGASTDGIDFVQDQNSSSDDHALIIGKHVINSDAERTV
jgi:hypothetical protein